MAQAKNLEVILSLIFLLSLPPISKFCQFYLQNRSQISTTSSLFCHLFNQNLYPADQAAPA